jgi:hypothetical protein
MKAGSVMREQKINTQFAKQKSNWNLGSSKKLYE